MSHRCFNSLIYWVRGLMKKIIFFIALIILSSIGSLSAGTVILENYQDGPSGDLYAGTWNIRDKFTKTYDDANLCTLYNNGLFKFKPGVYSVSGWAFGIRTNQAGERTERIRATDTLEKGEGRVSRFPGRGVTPPQR